jgi:predicted aspartyl protease
MSLVVDVEIESTDTAVKRCTQALIDCGATGCFIDIEWVKFNNVPTRSLTKPILVYNVDGTANDAGAITDIADVILRYENHSERTQLAVTRLGKQSLILGYNWLRNHNLEINWQTKDVKMSRCPLQCSTCRAEDKRGRIVMQPWTCFNDSYGQRRERPQGRRRPFRRWWL